MIKRPLGITLLAVYFALQGVGVLVLQLLFTSELVEAFSSFNSSAIFSMISLAFVGSLSIAAGVTMWLGKAIGWRLGIAHLVLSAIRNTWAIFLLYQMAPSSSEPADILAKLYLKHGLRVCFFLALVYYFYRPQVLSYFKHGQVPTSA
jgi:hypothetical protein